MDWSERELADVSHIWTRILLAQLAAQRPPDPL